LTVRRAVVCNKGGFLLCSLLHCLYHPPLFPASDSLSAPRRADFTRFSLFCGGAASLRVLRCGLPPQEKLPALLRVISFRGVAVRKTRRGSPRPAVKMAFRTVIRSSCSLGLASGRLTRRPRRVDASKYPKSATRIARGRRIAPISLSFTIVPRKRRVRIVRLRTRAILKRRRWPRFIHAAN